MWVKDYMRDWVNTIAPDKTLAEALKQMVEKKTNSMIVVGENNKPLGTLSARGLIKEVVPAYLKEDPSPSQFEAEGTFERCARRAKDKKVEDAMIKDVHLISVDDAMIEAAAYALKGSRRILPVVNAEGELVGAITRTCIKNAFYNVVFKKGKVDPKSGRFDNEEVKDGRSSE